MKTTNEELIETVKEARMKTFEMGFQEGKAEGLFMLKAQKKNYENIRQETLKEVEKAIETEKDICEEHYLNYGEEPSGSWILNKLKAEIAKLQEVGNENF